VTVLGRSYPQSLLPERLFWGLIMLGCWTCLVLAAFVLDPDPRGMGTHEQLGLPECGFVTMFDGPCPSCGFTTTFTLAAHLRPVDAFVNQPFGFLMFLLALAGAVVLPVAVFRRVSIMLATDRWPWWRIGLILLGLWMLGWGYKWTMAAGAPG
jgi:hypothetical protein